MSFAARPIGLLPPASAAEFNITISSNTTNYNLRTALTGLGWDQVTAVTATLTINSGIYVSSDNTGTPALTTGGAAYPGGSVVTIINAGFIVGRGGNGGAGRNNTFGVNSGGSAGATGGLALQILTPVSINNTSGTIAGGGGGGGGGQGYYEQTKGFTVSAGGGGGGGGRSSAAANSSGGAGGTASGGASNIPGNTGGTGTSSSAGAGGAGGAGTGAGGAGGAWGGNGGPGIGGAALGGGAAGGCVTGNTNIVWVANGTRLGSIT